MRRNVLPLALVVLLVGLFLAGHVARSRLGIELSAESIRTVVGGFGWKAPAIYLGILTFRQFLLLPSALVLSIGGAAFGASLGTVLGAAGIAISAALKYTIARGLGREWLRGRFGAAAAAFERHAGAAGPLVVGLATAHPAGPMAPVHWGAGVAGVPAASFAAAVALAAPIRAFAYAFFGSTLLEPGSARFWLAAALLVGAVFAPLAHPGLRERLWRTAGRGAGGA
jgi:uncharacterized membrane protein YdjX (TVP38/TMEM64 family)